MDLGTDNVRHDIDGPVAYVTIDRPERHNALTADMSTALRTAVSEMDENEAVRVIIITGAGEEAFCAGGDLEEHMPDIDVDGDQNSDLMFRHRTLTTPIIAAVNGYCVAAGMEFLQVTDIRIADRSAQFGLQEPRWGISPMGGSHVRLPRQLPYCRAMEFLLTGDLFSADHAREAGLINEVVPDGEALNRAEEVAASILKNSPFAVRKIKETVEKTRSRPESEAFRIETRIAEQVYDHSDADEGMSAFAEDRDPSYAVDWTPSRRK